ncbi:MAG: peptidoglycan glycosyltransferase, partial [Clostridia bacterium]|nr:peptidoglycan glycosyltransferase [Clostridia bacterium]
QPISSEIAKQLKDLMLETVNSGTGTAARISGIQVCGKTGTAENEMTTTDESKTHALFVGFAPYDNPEIAVSVILENAGFGGSVAAPIAREVMKTYFANK